jgi:hypothetical protein
MCLRRGDELPARTENPRCHFLHLFDNHAKISSVRTGLLECPSL